MTAYYGWYCNDCKVKCSWDSHLFCNTDNLHKFYRRKPMRHEKRRKGTAKPRKDGKPSPSTYRKVCVVSRPSSGLSRAIAEFKECQKLGYTPIRRQVIVDLSDMEFFCG